MPATPAPVPPHGRRPSRRRQQVSSQDRPGGVLTRRSGAARCACQNAPGGSGRCPACSQGLPVLARFRCRPRTKACYCDFRPGQVAEVTQPVSARSQDPVRADDRGDDLAGHCQPLIPPVVDPPPARGGERPAVQGDGAARAAHDAGKIGVPVEQARNVRARQPVSDVFRRPHQAGDQAAHLESSADVPMFRPDGTKQAAAELIGDAIGYGLGVGGHRSAALAP